MGRMAELASATFFERRTGKKKTSGASAKKKLWHRDWDLGSRECCYFGKLAADRAYGTVLHCTSDESGLHMEQAPSFSLRGYGGAVGPARARAS